MSGRDERPPAPHEYRAAIDVEGLSVQLDVVVSRSTWVPSPLTLAGIVGNAVSLAAEAIHAGILQQQRDEPAPF